MGKNYRDGNASTIIYLIVIATIFGSAAVEGIKKLGSNRDNVDLTKEYNVIEDYNYGSISLANIVSYSDYKGLTVEVVTQDGLKILTGTNTSELINVDNFELARKYAEEMTGNNKEKVVSYDEISGLDTKVQSSVWNKNIFNYNYDYNYAITETENGVYVRKIVSWRDWNEDDKLQLELEDGSVILTSYTNTKLISTLEAGPKSLYNYAVSLAGSEDKVYGDIDKDNQISSDYNHDLYDEGMSLSLSK